MKIINCEQRSAEWYTARCGVPTASEFDKIITSEGKPSKQRTKYMYQLIGEKLGGIVDPTYQSFAMQQGIEKESEARALYEIARSKTDEVGFCLSDDGYGCSPDGLVGEDGGVEIKCPIMSTHVEYLIKCQEEVPTDYFQQVQGSLLVTGRKWWDFVSYYPGLQPLIIREEPNEQFQRALKRKLTLFIEEMNDIIDRIKNV